MGDAQKKRREVTMISLTFKTSNKNLVERYKDALNVYDDWKTNTKISCVGAGFGKFMGIDLMIPIFFFAHNHWVL